MADPDERDDRSADGELALGRRHLLGALAAASVAGCASGDRTPTDDGDGDTQTPAAEAETVQTDGSGDGSGVEVSVDPETADRIEDHRTADLTVEVVDADGDPVEGAAVAVSMREHAFTFGTAVNASTLVEQSSAGDNYRAYIPELFNTAVIENQMKWAFWERDRQLADDAVQWLLERGLDVRGHVCLWGREDAGAIPSDVQTAIEAGDGETVRERSMAHIEEILTHYGDDVTEWEVVNEAMHAYQLQLGYYGDRIDTDQPWTGDVVPWTSELLAAWYGKAESVVAENDLDVGLGVNDFNQFAYSYTDDRYNTQIEHVTENGAELDTVGLQGHVGARTGEFNTNSDPDGRVDAATVREEIDKFAGHDATVKVTEFDTYGGDDWAGDVERAETLRNYLAGAFSHPDVDGFLMWGFWDGRHWRDEAPLFYEDWTEKPAYDVWTGLVHDEWWTEESAETDGEGRVTVTGFEGEYEVGVTVDGETVTETATLSEGGTTVTVTT